MVEAVSPLRTSQGASRRTTASFGLWPWVELARRNALPIEELCDIAQVTHGDLRDPGARFSQEAANRVAEVAFRRVGPGAAMAAAQIVQAGHFQLLELLARTAPTLGAALQVGCLYFPLLHDGGRMVHEVLPDGAHALIWKPPAGYEVHPGFVELTFGVTAEGVRREVGRQDIIPRQVWFRHAGPHDTQLHQRVLGTGVRFAMREDRMVFDRAQAALSMSRRNPVVHASAVREAADMLLAELR